MKLTCPAFGTQLEFATPPKRVVSLVSSATETLAALGCADALIGVSPYCSRYVADLDTPVVGDYLHADLEALKALQPDLVLVTLGIQTAFGRRLAEAGLPVFALPLPCSRFGILENQMALGGLMHRVSEARILGNDMEAAFAELRRTAPTPRPRVFVELWFGRHQRGIEGLTFIHDLVELAGGIPLFGHVPGAYPKPDLAAVASLRPEILLLFQEPEFPVDAEALLRSRGWDWAPRIVNSTVDRGRNIIHDGPSYLDTARWLRDQFRGSAATV
jgi:ABC-type Fe3+-hydroxamate transport system substrate-binding protein